MNLNAKIATNLHLDMAIVLGVIALWCAWKTWAWIEMRRRLDQDATDYLASYPRVWWTYHAPGVDQATGPAWVDLSDEEWQERIGATKGHFAIPGMGGDREDLLAGIDWPARMLYLGILAGALAQNWWIALGFAFMAVPVVFRQLAEAARRRVQYVKALSANPSMKEYFAFVARRL